jgi:predicted HicB family RNase H-like nuclease
MNLLKHKNYEGSAKLDVARGVCRGKVLFIADLVTYEAALPNELQQAFEMAVDDYIETCEQVGKEPTQPFKAM